MDWLANSRRRRRRECGLGPRRRNQPGPAALYLRHGDGTLIGSITVGDVETLPAALASLESLVREAGYPLHEVDLRLELLKGITDALDRYSRVLAGDRLQRFDVRLKGTLVGVGLTVSIREVAGRDLARLKD